jgi:hypothetical protein
VATLGTISLSTGLGTLVIVGCLLGLRIFVAVRVRRNRKEGHRPTVVRSTDIDNEGRT